MCSRARGIAGRKLSRESGKGQAAALALAFAITPAPVHGSCPPQAGYSQLQAAKKANPNYMERFAIYRREQEHLARTAQTKGNGESTLDLVSYVEFQRNFRCAPHALNCYP